MGALGVFRRGGRPGDPGQVSQILQGIFHRHQECQEGARDQRLRRIPGTSFIFATCRFHSDNNRKN